MAKNDNTVPWAFLRAQAFGILVSFITRYIVAHVTNMEGMLVTAQFFIIPLVMGIISIWRIDDEYKSVRNIIYLQLANYVGALLWAIVLFGEGYLCLLIVSPILLACMLAGGFIGKFIFRRKNKNLNTSLFGTLFLLYVLDVASVRAVNYEVSDTLIVNAPPSKVWSNVVAFDEVEDPSEFWLFDIGLPKVMKATVNERKVGGERKCVFENGIAFDEKIVVYEPGKDLTFDIVKMPEDPEIIGHINLKRGQFKLNDNGDGTTTLEGVSWYDLKVFPAWYYNIWAESITRNVHLRAMKHIKKLSER
ncbi:MAG: hypothetical protein ACKOXB_10750 [Flavobacteriales bacterium]